MNDKFGRLINQDTWLYVIRLSKNMQNTASVLFTQIEIMPISASYISETIQLISVKFILYHVLYATSNTKFERNRAISVY